MNINTLITTRELCQKLNIGLRTLARWRANGIPHIKVSRSTIRYDIDEIKAWLEMKNNEQRAEK